MSIDDSFHRELQRNSEALGIELSDSTLAKMWRHFELLVEKNKTTNLTRLIDPGEAAVKHYADSLALVAWARSTEGASSGIDFDRCSVLDVGTGAGFPAVPLAIACPSWPVTAIDGTQKKTDFLCAIAAELELNNLHVEHAHSEHWSPPARFDVVTFRALAGMDKGLATCGRFARPGGCVVAYKTAQLSAEESATVKSPPGGLRSREPFNYELRYGDEVMRRALYIFAAAKAGSAKPRRGRVPGAPPAHRRPGRR